VDTDRLLREVEKRLSGLPAAERGEALDAIREEVAREKRRIPEPATVERERQRRMEAETLREVLEAINRQARLEDTIDEVLKQLLRMVSADTCSLAVRAQGGGLRIMAVRGFPDPERVLGLTFQDALSDAVLESRWPASIPDVQEEPRFVVIEGSQNIRSWAGVPLLMEGQPIGLLCLDRHRVEPFDEEELHRAKALAFSAAAAIRKAQLLEQVRRYATLMECVVEVDQAVFTGGKPEEVARVILEGAARLGNYPAGVFVMSGPDGPRVGAGSGPFQELAGREAPAALSVSRSARLSAAGAAAAVLGLGVPTGAHQLYLVPLTANDVHLGTLALLDPRGTPDDLDLLMEAYASRAATAYFHAQRHAH